MAVGWRQGVLVVWLVDSVYHNAAGQKPHNQKVVEHRFAFESCDSDQRWVLYAIVSVRLINLMVPIV